MIREAIARLVDDQPLTREEACGVVREIMTGNATPAQIASFITALRIRGETPEIIAGCAQAMRANATHVAGPSDRMVDIVGTGGDGAHTFNISTCAALVAAGAGAVVAKHGNRSVSSRCGSADVLEALGVHLQLPPDALGLCLEKVGFAFLFAPTLHPAMKHAIGPRREIGVRTVFNILGPLCNPADTRRGLLGVYSAAMVPVLAEAALALGAEHLFVVHGLDGLDEITTTTRTLVHEICDGRIQTYHIQPGNYGLATARPEDLRGGTPEENAVIARSILAGEKGPRRDAVLLNAAAAIIAAGLAKDWEAGLRLAADSIDSGRAQDKLNRLVDFTRSAAPVA